MKLEVKFRREDHKGIVSPYTLGKDTTYIYIDVLVDGVSEGRTSPILFISGFTRDIGHLDPNINSFEEYRQSSKSSTAKRH
jgi:hypothetical protein